MKSLESTYACAHNQCMCVLRQNGDVPLGRYARAKTDQESVLIGRSEYIIYVSKTLQGYK